MLAGCYDTPGRGAHYLVGRGSGPGSRGGIWALVGSPEGVASRGGFWPYRRSAGGPGWDTGGSGPRSVYRGEPPGCSWLTPLCELSQGPPVVVE